MTAVGQTSAAELSLKLASVIRPMREVRRNTNPACPAYKSGQYRQNLAADIGLRCLQFDDTATKKF